MANPSIEDINILNAGWSSITRQINESLVFYSGDLAVGDTDELFNLKKFLGLKQLIFDGISYRFKKKTKALKYMGSLIPHLKDVLKSIGIPKNFYDPVIEELVNLTKYDYLNKTNLLDNYIIDKIGEDYVNLRSKKQKKIDVKMNRRTWYPIIILGLFFVYFVALWLLFWYSHEKCGRSGFLSEFSSVVIEGTAQEELSTWAWPFVSTFFKTKTASGEGCKEFVQQADELYNIGMDLGIRTLVRSNALKGSLIYIFWDGFTEYRRLQREEIVREETVSLVHEEIVSLQQQVSFLQSTYNGFIDVFSSLKKRGVLRERELLMLTKGGAEEFLMLTEEEQGPVIEEVEEEEESEEDEEYEEEEELSSSEEELSSSEEELSSLEVEEEEEEEEKKWIDPFIYEEESEEEE